jgi:hypothetical protein
MHSQDDIDIYHYFANRFTCVFHTRTLNDPIFALIAAKQAADVVHADNCRVLSDIEKRYDVGSDEAEVAFVNGGPACHAAYDAAWLLVTTPPKTLGGVAAVLRFVNETDDRGNWPLDAALDRQLRITMAQVIEATQKAVLS